jgi:hypothetical protein
MRGMGGFLALVGLVLLPTGGAAQEVTLSGGPAGYDLSGTGTSWAASARYGHTLRGPLSLEAGLSAFRYEGQSQVHVTYLMPEVGITARSPVWRTAVLLTVGGGYAAVVESDAPGEPTLFAALALDLPAKGSMRIRPSLRVRVVDPWVGTIGEYNLGVRIPVGS